MPKFNFNKGSREKDEITKEKEGGVNDLDELYTQDEDISEGFNDEDADFFDDEFGSVENPQDEGDLEAQAKSYAEVNEVPTYKKAQPKWYEKGANIVITIVIITFIVVTGLYVFREPIRGFIGSRSEDLRDLDLQGQVSDYQESVKDTLNVEDGEDEEVVILEVDEVETLPEGEYTVGVDMVAGLWVADEVLIDVYPSKQEYDEQKNPASSNVTRVDLRTYISLSEGQYIVVQGGELEFNETRRPTNYNIGDTNVLIEDEYYLLGKDLPGGFYTLYNTEVLEDGKGRDARGASLELLNPSEEDPDSIGVERKTTVFLREGIIVIPSKDLIIERVSSDGSYGDDLNILTPTVNDDDDIVDGD